MEKTVKVSTLWKQYTEGKIPPELKEMWASRAGYDPMTFARKRGLIAGLCYSMLFGAVTSGLLFFLLYIASPTSNDGLPSILFAAFMAAFAAAFLLSLRLLHLESKISPFVSDLQALQRALQKIPHGRPLTTEILRNVVEKSLVDAALKQKELVERKFSFRLFYQEADAQELEQSAKAFRYRLDAFVALGLVDSEAWDPFFTLAAEQLQREDERRASLSEPRV